jgi:transposase InsO family protein
MSRLFGVVAQRLLHLVEAKPSRRAQEDERLWRRSKRPQAHSRAYSARRLQPELAADGFVAGRDRIARLRRELGLRCRQKRKFKATTNSNHNLPVAENLLIKHLPRRSQRGLGHRHYLHPYRRGVALPGRC